MTLTTEQLDELDAAARSELKLDSFATCVLVQPEDVIHLIAVYRAALAWRAQITTLSLAAGLPQQVWADLCRLDSEMSEAMKGTS